MKKRKKVDVKKDLYIVFNVKSKHGEQEIGVDDKGKDKKRDGEEETEAGEKRDNRIKEKTKKSEKNNALLLT